MSGAAEEYCECGADLGALTDEAHAEGCANRPSLRTERGLAPTPIPPLRYDGAESVRLGMPTGELLAFIEREGLDVLVHAPRSRLHVEWTVAAWDYDTPQISGIGTAESFEAALVASLQSFERSAIASSLRAGPGSTLPPPLPPMAR